VDGQQTVSGGHAVGHAVKDRLIGRVPSISDVVVHVVPFGGMEDRLAGSGTLIELIGLPTGSDPRPHWHPDCS
jgi:hypothetical protein